MVEKQIGRKYFLSEILRYELNLSPPPTFNQKIPYISKCTAQEGKVLYQFVFRGVQWSVRSRDVNSANREHVSLQHHYNKISA